MANPWAMAASKDDGSGDGWKSKLHTIFHCKILFLRLSIDDGGWRRGQQWCWKNKRCIFLYCKCVVLWIYIWSGLNMENKWISIYYSKLVQILIRTSSISTKPSSGTSPSSSIQFITQKPQNCFPHSSFMLSHCLFQLEWKNQKICMACSSLESRPPQI